MDVLQGRGQGVQRHPGNEKYRHLVHVNKRIYAQCPRQDKVKISKGIVAAIREFGGRFLILDERTSVYSDIGDKKATEKTSQALREGQKAIRKQIYEEEARMAAGGNGVGGGQPQPHQRETSPQGYFAFSLQFPESLYAREEANKPAKEPDAVAVTSNPALAAALEQFPADPALAAALDQFPGAKPPALAARLQETPSPPRRPSLAEMRGSASGGSVMDMSCLSRSSVFEDLVRNSQNDRETIKSILSTEVMNLVRTSEVQILEVERLTNNSVAFDEFYSDRVSELRMTGAETVGSGAARGSGRRQRLTELSISNESLMNETMMTIPPEDMSRTSTRLTNTSFHSKKRTVDELSLSDKDACDLLAGLGKTEQGTLEQILKGGEPNNWPLGKTEQGTLEQMEITSL